MTTTKISERAERAERAHMTALLAEAALAVSEAHCRLIEAHAVFQNARNPHGKSERGPKYRVAEIDGAVARLVLACGDADRAADAADDAVLACHEQVTDDLLDTARRAAGRAVWNCWDALVAIEADLRGWGLD